MPNKTSPESIIGITFITTLFTTFLVLKLTHVIDWPWWCVTAPLWGGFGAVLILFFIALSVAFKTNKKRNR